MRSRSRWIYSARTLIKSPGFTLAVIVSLALGISANVAIYSVVNGLLFHPSGVSDPQTLMAPRVSYKKLGLDRIAMSATDFADVRNSKLIFSAAAMQGEDAFNYTGGNSPERLNAALVTWQWFDVFGVKPLLGRGFHAEEDQPGANHVVILSFEIWQRSFGGSRAILGRNVELNQTPYRVVGVMPREYRWPNNADLWTPIGLPAKAYAPENRFNENYFVVARLAPGVSVGQAAAFMKALTNRTVEQIPYARGSQWSMVIEPFSEYTAGNLKTPLIILLSAVGLVLLIACSNIAGLMLIRATARARDMAIRLALGATQSDLVAQVLRESALLAVIGTGLGLAGAFGLQNALLALARARLSSENIVNFDAHVLLFTLCIAIFSALLFSLVPAWHISRTTQPFATLKSGGRSETQGHGQQKLRSTLVVGQIALASLLLIGSGLLLRTLARLQDVDTGFQSRHVMTASVALPLPAYKDEAKQAAFWRSAVANLAQTPGVAAAAAANDVPFSGGDPTASFEVEGRVVPPGDPGFHGSARYVSPGYFQALNIRLLTGRPFENSDSANNQAVAVIDRDLARRYWRNRNPIGQRIRRGSPAPWATIVGVVAHVKQSSLATDAGRGAYYFCLYQQPNQEAFLTAHGPLSNTQLSHAIRAAVRQTDPAQSLFDLKTMDQRIALALGPQQLTAEILAGFAGLALVLAATGLYGVISYGVARRTKEFGIRIALGAERSRILGMVLSQTARVVFLGLFLGTIAASWLASLAASQLFHVTSLDAPTLAVAAIVLTFVALLATALPAWRAVRIDPVTALRNE